MEETPRSRFKPSRRHPPSPGWRESSLTRRRRRHSWLILDRFVHRRRRLHGVVECDSTTSYDCIGRPIHASFRVADFPAVSRLHLHLLDREAIEEDLEDMEEPSVNSILFKVVMPFKDSDWTDPFLFPIDYFVYSASSSSPPSLTRLPVCFEGVPGHPEEDKYFHLYRRQRQRVMLDAELGGGGGGDEGCFSDKVCRNFFDGH